MRKSLSSLYNKKIRLILAESWSVCWPMMLIMFFEALIGLTDVFVAGQFGKEVKAAYGLCFQIYFVFILFGIALSVGSVSVLSRLFTAGKKEEYNLGVHTSYITSFVVGLILAIMGVLFSPVIITLLNVPEAVKGYAIPFLTIYSLCILFDYLVIMTNGILRASQMIKKSLRTMVIVCVLNIILDIVLSLYTPLRFQGIAIATVISLFLGSLLNTLYVRRLVTQTLHFSFALLKKILKISWPSAMLQILWQLGSMTLFLILSNVAMHNVTIMAAFTTGLMVESMIFLPAFAFNMANAVVVGNLLGKKQNDDAYRSGIVTAVTGVVIISILSLLIMLNARFITSLLSKNALVIDHAVTYIRITLLFEPIMALGVILGGALSGAGDTKTVMKIVGLGVWMVRIPLCYLLGVHFKFGPNAIWWSMNASAVFQCIFMVKRYRGKKWIA